MLLFYVKKEHAEYVSDMEAETVGTGIMGRMVRLPQITTLVYACLSMYCHKLLKCNGITGLVFR